MSDKIVSPEIVKLMDKITQNPTSRLFVPLAEEYLKCDLVDEAIIVLVEGIKNHPSYVAARVMLGKIYLQENRISEAQAEFEKVIAINSDNILAHKKLAVIYQGQGQLPRALETCKKVLMIDPSDKEAKGLMGALEMAPDTSVQLEEAAASSSPPLVAGPGPASEAEMKGADPASPIEPVSRVEEILNQDPPPEMSIEKGPMLIDSPVFSEESSFGVREEPGVSFQAEDNPPEVSENQKPAAALAEVVGEAPVENPAIAEERNSIREDSWEGDKTVVAGFDIASQEKESVPSPTVEVTSTSDEEDQKEAPLLSATLASLYMSQGHYQEAADVYQKLLARDPSDEESREGFVKALQSLAPKQGGEGFSEESSGSDNPKKKKTQRLQSWLDSIRKKNEP